MIRYLLLALAGQLRGGRALLALAVAGVALGVGAVLSIQILNASALGAFAGSVRAISGEAQLTVVGRGPTLPDRLLDRVLAVPGVGAALPIVRIEVALEGRAGETLEVVGTDLLAPVRLAWDQPFARLTDALAKPGWVAVTPAFAAEMGWARGARVAVSSGSRKVTLEVAALVDFQKVAPLASRRLALMDISQAQALLGAAGRVQQIDVVAAPGEDVPALQRRLEERLGPAARVVTPEQRVAEAGSLLSAFRLNLTALSLVSLFVGGFLVYASTQAALARRREELGVLRCLGATRGQVVGLVLADAGLLGLLGTAIGIPLGWLAARANLSAVSATIRTLYLVEGVERVTLSPALVAAGVVLGLVGALSGALVPALDVAREDPRALLAERAAAAPGRAPRRLAAWAVATLAAASLLALGPARPLAYSGFGLALAVLVAVPLLAPALLRLAGSLRPPARLGVAYGARDLAAHLRASSVAAGALAVAVSMLAGITVMIGSFRTTVQDWLSATLRADVYVTTPTWRRGRGEATLAPGIVPRMASTPGVVAVDRLRQLSGEVNGRQVSVSGIDAGLRRAGARVQLLSGDAAAALRRLRDEGAVLVSEPLARKVGIATGREVELLAPNGPARLPVAGIYRDYGAERGAVLMDLGTMERLYGPGGLTNAALYLAPGVDPEQMVARLRAEFPDEALLVRSNRRLRADVLAVFDQTFAVTRLLQVMSLLVATAGVTLALLVLARERASEIALYRALGATRGQIALLFVGRALGIGVGGLLLGAVGGAGLALVLVELVNPAWFGWSIALHPPWRTLLEQSVVLMAAALLASLYPAARASRTPVTELSRDAL